MYETYRQHATFYVVYIREAHPTDGWQLASNREEHVEYAQPQTFIERQEVANACMIGLRLSIPALIDAMDNRADIAFNGWPERLYALSPQGEIVYQGGKGPYGFDIDELDRFLEGIWLENLTQPLSWALLRRWERGFSVFSTPPLTVLPVGEGYLVFTIPLLTVLRAGRGAFQADR